MLTADRIVQCILARVESGRIWLWLAQIAIALLRAWVAAKQAPKAVTRVVQRNKRNGHGPK